MSVEFENCVALKESPQALLVEMEDGAEIWIPKSQITDDSEVYARDTIGTLIITEWIATQKGLV